MYRVVPWPEKAIYVCSVRLCADAVVELQWRENEDEYLQRSEGVDGEG